MKRVHWFGRIYRSNCWLLALKLLVQGRSAGIVIVKPFHVLSILHTGYLLHFKEKSRKPRYLLFVGQKQLVTMNAIQQYVLKLWW